MCHITKLITKLITAIKDAIYEDRLCLVNLASLETRRLRGDLIEVFKIFKGFDDLDPNIRVVHDMPIFDTDTGFKSIVDTDTDMKQEKY